MVPYKITLAYDGRSYFGWQRLGDQQTLQGTLEEVLHALYDNAVAVAGAGRTDRGVHAEGQVISVQLPVADPDVVLNDLRSALPTSIVVLSVEVVPEDFHARMSATGKRYRYEIFQGEVLPADLEGRVWQVRRPLDAQAMKAAAPLLVGEHDYASFASRPRLKPGTAPPSTVRTIHRIDVVEEGPRITLTFEADSFLYKMVRNLVKALSKVGEGKWSAADLRKILEAEDRQAAVGTAPASGLYLDAVFYANRTDPSASAV